MSEINGQSKRCRCGYRIYILSYHNGFVQLCGNEQDELGGVILRWCPQCEAKLAIDDLLSESQYQDVTRRDDWEAPGSAARLFEPAGYEQVESVHAHGLRADTESRANAGDVVWCS